jgi:predicted nucleotidyltransferase
MKRSAVREAVGRFRAANPRVFGSVLHGTDRDGSDLDLLVDALPGATLLDLGDLEEELKSLLGVDVDLLTPGDLPPKFRPRCSRRRNRYEREPPARLPRPHSAGRNRCAQLREGMAKDDFLADKRTAGRHHEA